MTRFLWMLLLLVVMLTGCNQRNKAKEVVAELNKTNIQKVSNAFGLFASWNGYKSPKSKQELVEFIQNKDGIDYNLELMGIDRNNFEDTFISTVDGEEFIIRYKSRVSAMGTGAPIAFEKNGVDGIRRVGLSNGTVVEADDETYKRLMAGKVKDGEAGEAFNTQSLDEDDE